MGRIIEGTWDCKYCGTSEIKGRFRECPNCGKPRDENTSFKLPKNIEYVSEEVEKNINRNPDWICPFCDSLNSDSDTHCKSCGSARDSKNLDYFENKKSHSVDSSYYSNKSLHEPHSTSGLKSLINSFNLNFLANHWKLLSAISLSLILLFSLIYFLIPKEQSIIINGFKWERSIEIEKYQTVEESDWNLPENARLNYTRTEIHSYAQVLDHYETRTRQVSKERLVGYEEYVTGYRDLGNGYFEEQTAQRPIYETYYETEYYDEPIYRSDPIYRTKYYYEIDKWLHERSVKTSEETHYPYWGETNLNSDERIATKNEVYYITYMDKKDRVKELKINYDDWKTLRTNQTIKVKFSKFGTYELIK